MSTTKNNVESLVKRLRELSDLYYNGEAEVSDAEFDSLKEELEKIDPENDFLKEIGAPVTSGVWPKKKHSTIMTSLGKVNTRDEFTHWCKDKGDDLFITEKADGCTVVASYIEGKLVSLATRGDGTEGENITPNAAWLKDVKKEIKGFTGDLRGEAMLRREVFDKEFLPMGYKNPRNAANGKLREQKDTGLIKYIEIQWFDVMSDSTELKTENDKFSFLKKNGLNVVAHQICNAEGAWKIFEDYINKKRISLNYEIDGLVVKVNSLETQKELGISSGRPKGAVAIKFPAVEKMTVLEDVEWQRGLKGRFTPVGILKPVDIGGVTITRCSLHGMDQVEKLGVHIGDKVMVVRANDVIPQITRRVSDGERKIKIVGPSVCDSCDGELVEDGAYLLCVNKECPGELYGRLVAWVTKLNIMGIGPAIIVGLIEQGIKEIDELYTCDISVFDKASGSEKIGEKIWDELHNKKEMPLRMFLNGLSIPTLGNTNSQRFETTFKTLDKVLSASVDEIGSIQGIKTNATKMWNGLKEKRGLIGRLRKLLIIKDLEESGGKPLSGKSFCITGALTKPRKEIESWIKDNGGETKSSVGKGLTYLVTNEPNSGSDKNAKADKYGVTKITEEELYKLV